MKNLNITIFLIFFIGVWLDAQGNLEVSGKIKIGEMDLVTTGDSVVVRQADGTLAIREILTSAGLSIDSVYTYDPGEVGGPLSLIIQYTDMSRDTLSGALVPGPQGDKGDDGVGIAQTISLISDSLTLSDGGGKVRIDTSNTNEKITGFGIIGDSLYLKEGSMDTMKVKILAETDPRLPEGTTLGEMLYWNGTAWVIVAATVNDSATLQIIGGVPTWVGGITVPDAPTIGVAISGEAAALVSFTEPVFDGGSAITGYIATAYPGGITSTASSSPIYVAGLANGTTYTFTVIAINAIGNSAPSAASNSVTPETIPSVVSSTGKVWMDRNLGASQVATSSTDEASFGDLYQWGRDTDGHQLRASDVTTTRSLTDSPVDGKFIRVINHPQDWRNPKNDNLWQGVTGQNNPCPLGYRIPTDAEWEGEWNTWGSDKNSVGAFASPLKLPMAGWKGFGFMDAFGLFSSQGDYWSSTVDGTYGEYVRKLQFTNSTSGTTYNYRSAGSSVRCIRD